MAKLQDYDESDNLESKCRQIRQEYLEDEELLQMKEEIEQDKAKRKIRIPKYVPEPQVTSQNPEERKLARRLRILRRKQYMTTKIEPLKEIKEINVVEMQIRKTMEKLFFIEKEVLKPVENIRLASEIRESRREKTEGERSRRRRGELDDEAEESYSKFAELCDGWELILAEQDNPLDLRNSLLEHKKKCQEFLDQKDAIIEQLKVELKVTNEKIEKDEFISKNDLSAIGDKAMGQVQIIKKAFDHHLELIQKVSDAHRTNEVHKLENKVEELRRLRNLKQLKYQKKITDMKIDFEQEMTSQRRELKEELNRMRNELERDQLEMEFVFSDVLGQCVVNAAKIYYNVEVLKGRVIENEYLLTHQTHRLRSVSTEAKHLQTEIQRLENEMNTETERVHKEARLLYKRITDNQNRSQISTVANDKQYRDMWKLNRTNIMNLANRVLQTDRVIYERYLGLDWTPALNIWTEMDEFDILPSYSKAFQKFNTKLYGGKPSEARCDSDISLEKPRGERQVPMFTPVWEGCEKPPADVGQEQQIAPQPSAEPMQDQFVATLMHHVSDTSAFVVGQRLLDLIEAYDVSAKDVVKLDALFRALGVEKEELLPLLKKCFWTYASCMICQRERTMREESGAYPEVEPEDADDLEESTVETQTSFAEDSQQMVQVPKPEKHHKETETKGVRFQVTEAHRGLSRVRKTSTVVFKVCSEPDKHPHTIKHIYVPLALNDFSTTYTRLQTVTIIPLEERLAQPGLTLSRALISREVATFWTRWCGVLPQDREDVWDAFFIGLKRYYQLLKDRSQLNRKLNTLRKQNEELKHILQNYCKKSKTAKKEKPVLKIESQIDENDLLPKLYKPAIKLSCIKPSICELPKLPVIHETEATKKPANHASKVTANSQHPK